ncbi:MAG: hypothetical protein ACLQMH_10095 [Solirubrobacteraceae bacterium]
MGEEVELAAKTTGEVVTALTEASGALGPPQEFWSAITSGIHYRFYPRVLKQAMVAAEKIRQSGLPRRAYAEIPDRLLKAILEGGSMEGDGSMQERWANLLANGLTMSHAGLHTAFPRVLGELEPVEAATLDRLADRLPSSHPPEEHEFRPAEIESVGILGPNLDNLVRVGLLRYTRKMDTTVGTITDAGLTVSGATFTDFGWAFVQACREPRPAD